MQYGTKVLQVLSLRGGNASQAELAAEVGLGQDRLGPILAGLQHNGYVARSFAPDRITVTLTDEGLRWLAKSSGAVPAQQPARPAQQQRQQPQPAPQVQAQAQAPQVQTPQTSDVRRRLGLGKPAVAPIPAPEPAPQAAPAAAPEPPAPVAEEAPVTEVTPQSDLRRPRRRKGQAKEEIATDESGFVTHIKGKAIF